MKGFGPTKLERYGDDILAVVAARSAEPAGAMLDGPADGPFEGTRGVSHFALIQTGSVTLAVPLAARIRRLAASTKHEGAAQAGPDS